MTSIHCLPPEVRHIIWKLAATRLIEVRWRSAVGFSSSIYPPSMLTLCHESHDVTQELFRLPEENCPLHEMPLNWDIHTLYFPYPSPCFTSYGRSLGHFLNRYPNLKDLKHLALCLPPRIPADGTCMEFLRQVQERARRTMKYGLELESLTLVFGDPYMLDFKHVPTVADALNPSDEAPADTLNQPMNTLPLPDRGSHDNVEYSLYSKHVTALRNAAHYLHDIDDTRTSPQQRLWNRDAAAAALNFYLGLDLEDVGRLGVGGPPRKCPSFGSPKIIWKGVTRGVEEDDLEA